MVNFEKVILVAGGAVAGALLTAVILSGPEPATSAEGNSAASSARGADRAASLSSSSADASRVSKRSGLAQRSVDELELRGDDHIAISLDRLVTMAQVKVEPPKGKNFFSHDDAVVSLLEVEADQQQAIETHWSQVQATMEADDIQLAEFRDEADGSFTIQLADSPELEKKAQQKFLSQLEASLGEARGRALFALKGGEQLFDRGAEGVDRSIRISFEDQGNGAYRYRIEEHNGENQRVYLADAIPEKYRHLTDAAGVKPVANIPTGEDE